MAMEWLVNPMVWIAGSIFFGIFTIGMIIFYILLFKRTHAALELKAWMSGTPIGVFFQDNKFADWKPITPLNGIVYDKFYGPFIVSTTYVDRTTKNIMIPFDVDMDGDRSSNVKELVDEFRNTTNNEKNITNLRVTISNNKGENNKNIRNMTSEIKYGVMKNYFDLSGPHNIKSKIEKIITERIKRYANVNPMHAIMVFGAIFGMIIIATILLQSTGGVN